VFYFERSSNSGKREGTLNFFFVVISSFLTIGCETYKTLWKMTSNFFMFYFGRPYNSGKRDGTENVLKLFIDRCYFVVILSISDLRVVDTVRRMTSNYFVFNFGSSYKPGKREITEIV
jgi:hypothetical protein